MKITNCRSAGTTRDVGVSKIFDWWEPNHKSQVMTSSEIFESGRDKGIVDGKEGIFCGDVLWDEDVVDWKIEAMACVFALNQDFAIGEDLNQKLNVQKCKLGDVLSKLE